MEPEAFDQLTTEIEALVSSISPEPTSIDYNYEPGALMFTSEVYINYELADTPEAQEQQVLAMDAALNEAGFHAFLSSKEDYHGDMSYHFIYHNSDGYQVNLEWNYRFTTWDEDEPRHTSLVILYSANGRVTWPEPTARPGTPQWLEDHEKGIWVY